jgi:glycosyltransferase involved in cell wall biosynthesis
MKILWLNWRCWLNPAMGGAEVFTYEVAKRFVAMGHEVTLLTSTFKGCKKEETFDGIKIVRVGGRFTVYSQAKRLYNKRFRNTLFDVIIDEINTRPFFAKSFASNGEKVVALIHQLAREYWFYETSFPFSFLGYHYFENHWLKQYVNIPTITVSQSTFDDLAQMGFKRVFIVPEGLNFEPLLSLPNKSPFPVIVFAGRLKPAKRPDHAIKAFNIINAAIPTAELWVIGEGSFKKTLMDLAGPGVKFYSSLHNESRRELIKQSWLLVVPGVREGWGLNVIEANALGVPSVVYCVPGLRDSVKNEGTGIIVEAGNIHALAESITALLKDTKKLQQLSSGALNYAKEFSWDKTATDLLKIIELL